MEELYPRGDLTIVNKEMRTKEEKVKHATYMREYNKDKEHRKKKRLRDKKYYKENKEKILKQQNGYYLDNRDEKIAQMKQRYSKLKETVYANYGNKCMWPGCDVIDSNMMEIDHINCNGNKFYKEGGCTSY